ncbi:sigma-54-dependent Fis family transcriptional regulator [Pullulanibacillus camelliae]|uniref:Sigma-54-dependent Fis family transcriptional regulator n=1 Tax=Pullulanibacillus camelliae TaxID=1707096 RepID=A0A8J2YFJ5_9BACL|nr:sigma 54-interacting transcriptional regulator [Pullulanibacillus camelliae]GGE30063.1 sigma-54-dependent Fis family transcriptional regulator [Pullulanibacillus camelliae]
MSKIVIIAPSKEFADKVRPFIENKPFKLYAPKDDRDFSFEETVPIAKKEEALGAEVIITRGGQATLLNQTVDIPVVEVKMTVLDILRTVHSLKTRYEKIGLIGVENIICDYRELGTYIDIQIYPVFSYEQDLDIQVQHAISDQMEFIVGDGMSVDYARQFGLPGIKLMPSRESVKESIEMAEHLVQARYQERMHSEQFRMVLETAQDGILIITNDRQVLLANNRASYFLQKERTHIINHPIKDVLKHESGLCKLVERAQEFNGEIVRIRDFILSVSKRTITVNGDRNGSVITMQDITHIQNLEQSIRRKLNHTGFVTKHHLNDMVAHAPNMKNVIQKIKHFSDTDSTVLLIGETGTGKELVAQSIHNLSPRHNRPFVPINCGALPSHLLESELFGYEAGAFTGADRNGKAGFFELAHTGTIFLDEIGEIPPELQTRLLRVIQEREIRRIGGSSIIPVDVRIIAATHRDLEADISAGRFRADLFYRLNILRIALPPLREREEDLPDLIATLLKRVSLRYQCEPPHLPDHFMTALSHYHWPGNIRELENILERLVVLFNADISQEAIFAEIIEELQHSTKVPNSPVDTTALPEGTLEAIEKQAILNKLNAVGGNKELAAKALGISRATLWRKLKDI